MLSPVWYGFYNAADKAKTRSVHQKGYIESNFKSFKHLCSDADDNLLKNILSDKDHVLQQFRFRLKQDIIIIQNFRPRRHDLTLPHRVHSSSQAATELSSRML